jgi:hypothetical protein
VFFIETRVDAKKGGQNSYENSKGQCAKKKHVSSSSFHHFAAPDSSLLLFIQMPAPLLRSARYGGKLEISLGPWGLGALLQCRANVNKNFGARGEQIRFARSQTPFSSFILLCIHSGYVERYSNQITF